GLDLVAVGIEDKGAIVVLVIDRSQAGLAVVLAAGGEGGAMERIDGLAVLGGEGDVGATAGLDAAPSVDWRPDPELDLVGGDAVAGAALVVIEARHAERLQHGVVERLAALQVGDAERDVVEHGAVVSAATSGPRGHGA